MLAKLLDKFDPKSDGADRSYADIYDESSKLLYEEIDYIAEGKNAKVRRPTPPALGRAVRHPPHPVHCPWSLLSAELPPSVHAAQRFDDSLKAVGIDYVKASSE